MTTRNPVRSAACAAASAMLALALAAMPAMAANAIFAEFATPARGAVAVKGASADADMAKLGALEIESLSFGIENPLVIDPAEGALGPGRPSFTTLTMALPLGPGVPALLQTSAAGGHYGDVTLHLRKDGSAVDYATLSLKVVAVARVEVSASAGGPPQATVDLTYGSMKLDVFAQDASGAVAKTPETGQWNAMTGTADFATVPRP
jgi:type VI protein secretion system component Hcp